MNWTKSKPKTGRGNEYWHCVRGAYFYQVKHISNGFRWEVKDRSGVTVAKGSKKTLSQAKTAAKNFNKQGVKTRR